MLGFYLLPLVTTICRSIGIHVRKERLHTPVKQLETALALVFNVFKRWKCLPTPTKQLGLLINEKILSQEGIVGFY